MKFRWIAAAFIAAIASGAGSLTYLCMRPPALAASGNEDDALLWLRQEFKIPSEKMTRIAQLHAAYQDVCDEHCRAIREARKEVRRLRELPAQPADISAAEKKSREVDLVCTTSLEAHLREIAGIIGGVDGERYLTIVLPRIARFEHTGAPKLDLNSTHEHAGHAAH